MDIPPRRNFTDEEEFKLYFSGCKIYKHEENYFVTDEKADNYLLFAIKNDAPLEFRKLVPSETWSPQVPQMISPQNIQYIDLVENLPEGSKLL